MIDIRVIGGVYPKLDPVNLPPHGAQVAVDCFLSNGTLRGLRQPSYVWTTTKAPVPKTIYRFGQNVTDETQYWFHWSDVVDVVKGQIFGDTAEKTYFTGDSAFGHPRWTNSTLALTGGGTNYPIASRKLGIPAPATACSGSASGSGSGSIETRAYVYTYVSEDGEEGQPSPPFEINVIPGQTVNLSFFDSAPSDHNINRRRIYRTVLGASSGTDYQFVAEITSTANSFADNVSSSSLGRTLNTLDYEMPPAGLSFIRNMPNGIIIGAVGNDIYFCEPFKPYAWPSKYVLTVPYPVVGIGVFGNTAVICTNGKPSIIWGSSPDNMTVQNLDINEACVARRSIVEMGWGVVYASNNGLVAVDASGARLVTEALIERSYWQSLNPASMHAYTWNGRYVCFFDNGVKQGFIFDPKAELQPLSFLSLWAEAGYTDPVRDALFLVLPNKQIVKFEGQTTLYTYRWRSRQYEIEPGINYSWGKIAAKSYPVTIRVYSSDDVKTSPTFGQMLLRHTRTVTDHAEFSMPSGFRSRRWEIELEGNVTVTRVMIANDTREFRGG
jgi:hypothetical protein